MCGVAGPDVKGDHIQIQFGQVEVLRNIEVNLFRIYRREKLGTATYTRFIFVPT